LVVQDEVGAGEALDGPQREQPGVARPGSDEEDARLGGGGRSGLAGVSRVHDRASVAGTATAVDLTRPRPTVTTARDAPNVSVVRIMPSGTEETPGKCTGRCCSGYNDG